MDTRFSFLNCIAFLIAKEDGDKRKTKIPCWLTMSDECRAEFVDKARAQIRQINGFLGQAMTDESMERQLQNIPQMAAQRDAWEKFELDMVELRKTNPRAYFVA